MTAVDVDALDKLRDRLAAALVFDCGLTGSADEARAAIDKLWPVVDRIANERAAAELRAIGNAGLAASPGAHPVRVPVSYLFDRAAALRASNGEGT